MDLQKLGAHIQENLHTAISFGVGSESDRPSDYAFVWLRLSEVVMVTIDGYVDDEFLASVWDLPTPSD